MTKEEITIARLLDKYNKDIEQHLGFKNLETNDLNYLNKIINQVIEIKHQAIFDKHICRW